MTSLLLLGGARSGKSSLAQQVALQHANALKRPVTQLVSGVVTDDEMAERIARHQQSRPSGWHVIEAPYDLDLAVGTVDSSHIAVIDCVTVFLSNLLIRGDTAADIERRGDDLAAAIAVRAAPTIVVSNEVGTGVVPPSELGRSFRDIQGRVNQQLAAVADESWLVVAGRVARLDDPATILAKAAEPKDS